MGKNITIARLNTLVTANAAQFSQELDRAQAIAKTKSRGISSALDGLGSKLAGALTIGGAVAFGKSLADYGSNIVHLAEQANLSTRSFQVLSAVAVQNGVEMQRVATASEKMRMGLQRARENAADPLHKSLRALGLTATGLSGLNTDQKWEAIAIAMSHANNEQAAFNAATALFGEEMGPKMRSTLRELAVGFDAASRGVDGLMLDDSQLRSLEQFGSYLDRIGIAAKVMAANLLDRSKGFDDMWRSAKTFLGMEEKIGKGDVRARGGFVLPGSNLPAAKTRGQEIDDMMLEAQKKEWAREWQEHQVKMKQIHQRNIQNWSSPEYQMKVRESLNALTVAPRNVGTQAPTDAYSRIGLASTDSSPTVTPQKETNEHLKKVNETLKQIRDGLSHLNKYQTAAFGN